MKNDIALVGMMGKQMFPNNTSSGITHALD